MHRDTFAAGLAQRRQAAGKCPTPAAEIDEAGILAQEVEATVDVQMSGSNEPEWPLRTRSQVLEAALGP